MAQPVLLNTANYKTIWDDNFTRTGLPNSTIFTEKWGSTGAFSTANHMLTITSSARDGWTNAGFLQPDFAAKSSQGYGLYSATFSMNAGEGAGVAILLWPASNIWPGPEMDLAEDWNDPTRQTGYFTLHYADASGHDQFQSYSFHADMTKPLTAALDWEAGSLSIYIGGTQVLNLSGALVAKDYAHGGANAAFGAEVTGAGRFPVSSQVSLHLYDLKYSAYVPPPATAKITAAAVQATPKLIAPPTETITAATGNTMHSFTTVSGHVVINNFLPTDTLYLGKALQATMVEQHTAGGLLVEFGGTANTIMLTGVKALPAGQLHFF